MKNLWNQYLVAYHEGMALSYALRAERAWAKAAKAKARITTPEPVTEGAVA